MVWRVGIDVGGTFTDAVLLNGQHIENIGKTPTQPDNLLDTILKALDGLNIANKTLISEITVSTTLVTNAILQHNLPQVELILIPGSGMKLTALNWPVRYRVLSGELDYRGREVLPLQPNEWRDIVDTLQVSGDKPLAAIISKFSHRNNILEEQLAAFLRQNVPAARIALGSQWGQSNFYRRSLTTYLNLACSELFEQFSAGLQEAITTRGYTAPLRMLKADGGVLPIGRIRPVESVYSGPAASVLGALAQSDAADSYVVVDIGGTTTDIGLVLSGSPLLSSRGAQLSSFLTNIRSLAVRSIAVGGDSTVLFADGVLTLAPYRTGPAYCIGGPNPTPTDAMRYLELSDYGSFARAEAALASLLPSDRRDPETLRMLAADILQLMVDRIGTAIEQLLDIWKTEPAYKVWEVLHQHSDFKFYIQMSGGASPGFAGLLAKRMNTKAVLVGSSGASNAIGAAMARPTFSWTMHLDTHLGRYRIEETGEQQKWAGAKKPHKEVEKFLKDLAKNQAETMGVEAQSLQQEAFDYFPLVDGYQTVGQIIRGTIFVPPAVRGRVEA